MRDHLAALAPVLALGIIACGEGDSSVWTSSSASASVCGDCYQVIFGRERQFDLQGKLLKESTLGQVPSASAFWDELQSGFAPDGRRYISASGTTSDGIIETRYQYVALASGDTIPAAAAEKPIGEPAAFPVKQIPNDLASVVAANPAGYVEVLIDLIDEPQTSLAPHVAVQFDWLEESGQINDWDDRIQARKAEVMAFQQPLRSALEEAGAKNIESFWLTGNVFATVPAAGILAILLRGDVQRIELNHYLPGAGASEWDGTDMKAVGGLNAGVYINNGYDGNALVPATGNPVTIAILDESFDFNHPILNNTAGGSTRVCERWDCWNNPCTSGTPYPPTGTHGTVLSFLAAGDARDGQMGGTTAWQLDHTGVSEESWLNLINISDANGLNSDASLARGIQKAVAINSDIISIQRAGSGSPCDGNTGTVDEAIWSAHTAGKLVITSAGNNGHAGASCTLSGAADVLGAFIVGGVGSSPTEVTSTNYLVGDIYSSSSRGGINVTINGSSWPGVVTGVSALAPACPYYKAVYDDTFVETVTCGTSYAAPQISGAAALVEDFYLQTEGSFIVGGNGRLLTVLQSMTDRAYSTSAQKTSGFDNLWGGGHFQQRLFTAADDVGVFAKQHNVFRLMNGQTQTVIFGSSSSEPSALNQFKAYALFFEEDSQDIADIDIYIKDQNCGTGSAYLGSDVSRDTKSMVRLSGSQAANKALCAQVYAYYIPPGQVREVNLFMYYSTSTTGR